MRRFSLLAFIGVWAFVIPAHAQITDYYVLGDNNWNTAAGSQALGYEFEFESSAGACQTPSGTSYACGDNNTAVGQQAAFYNETGSGNTAVGTLALGDNFSGDSNTAIGYNALRANTASANTATGYYALYENTSGLNNTAIGYQALYSNNGNGNAAQGTDALYKNDSGIRNLGLGVNALYNNTSGSYNVGLGYEAGYNLNTGSNNIDIGSPGLAGDSGMIRIGTISSTNVSTQTATYIAGISGTTVSGAYVCVSSKGQLGTNSTSCATPSSRRYKEDIQPMAELSERLLKLRPVTFRYKTADADGNKSLQYGLIAEEVAEVFPELVVFDNDGQPDAVKYQVLTPMLLNEMQKQEKKLAAQDQRAAAQDAEISRLKQQLGVMQAALVKLQAKGDLVATR
jgi:hypothetical protein